MDESTALADPAAKFADAPTNTCKGCQTPTTEKLSCPTCRKLNLPPAFFCSQECFKASWPKHKVLHTLVKSLQSPAAAALGGGHLTLVAGFSENDRKTWSIDPHLSRFISYSFSGDLRPWPITPQRVVQQGAGASSEAGRPAVLVEKPDYADDVEGGVPLGEKLAKRGIIEIQSAGKIEALRECCLLARQALDLAGAMVAPGVTTDAIDTAVHDFCIEHGAYPSPLNYFKFPKSCCTSVNEVICHGIPDLRPLRDGDIVNVDITLYFKGVHGDLNETFMVGDTVDEASKHLLQGAYDCLMTAIKKCKPGVMYRELGDVISTVADRNKLAVVRSYCGHGIGSLFHTTPNVPHYRKNKAAGIMKPGHVFTIEPMINQGHHRDVLWPDDWTAATSDGKRSAQFEHTLLITDTGVDILTARLPSSPSLGSWLK